MVNFVRITFLTFYHFVLRIFKRALCCFRRRRTLSNEPVPLTNIGIVSNTEKKNDAQSWDTWDETPTIITVGKPTDPIQQQIELYRQQKIAKSNTENEESKINYFEDMTPRIVKQTKMFLASKEDKKPPTAMNISLAPDITYYPSELGIWDDTQTWEDQTQEYGNTNDMLREKKKIDREKRLVDIQKKKLERESRGGKTLQAIKLS